jgi:hypothetical protein
MNYKDQFEGPKDAIKGRLGKAEPAFDPLPARYLVVTNRGYDAGYQVERFNDIDAAKRDFEDSVAEWGFDKVTLSMIIPAKVTFEYEEDN